MKVKHLSHQHEAAFALVLYISLSCWQLKSFTALLLVALAAFSLLVRLCAIKLINRGTSTSSSSVLHLSLYLQFVTDLFSFLFLHVFQTLPSSPLINFKDFVAGKFH